MANARRGGVGEDQDKYFNDASENVRRNAFYMQQALDGDNLHDAIRHSSNMINELRTSKLYPTRYYELYMNVTNHLTHLESYIDDEYKKKVSNDKTEASRWLKDLYNRVQFCGNIIPRLYLLMTVSSVCIKVSKGENEAIMEILFDLVSLTKGVQHPTRGLFLRNYLSQVSRLLLPDVPDASQVQSLDDHPVIKKSVDFVLQNFAEMTRLWVRMQHQGAVRDRGRRERERLQLRMLVGTNLRRLSELNVVSKPIYKEYVLKKISEQIIKCKDKIAQEYLMECIIMVFSDEYHMSTLDDFLSTVSKLHPSVSINHVIIKMMERLSKYAESSAEHRQIFAERDIFEVFQQYCKQILDKHKKMSIEDILALYVELVNFAAQCYPDRDKYIADMVKEALNVIVSNNNTLPPAAVASVHRMLVSPLNAMNLRVLDVPEYCQLITYLNTNEVRSVSADMIAALVAQEKVYIQSSEQIEKLFTMIEPLIYDTNKKMEEPKKKKKKDSNADSDDDDDSDDDSSTNEPKEDDEEKKSEEELEQFDNEQHLIARLVSLIFNPDTDQQYKALHVSRKAFGKGGEKRLLYTFPALIFNCLGLIQRTFALLSSSDGGGDDDADADADSAPAAAAADNISVKPKKMFQFVHKTCDAYAPHSPETACRLWLSCGLAADRCGFEEISYEFLSQAFITFEEYISDSKEQFEALRCIIGGLQQIRNLDEESFDTLRSKSVQHSQRLLKKPACARSFVLCCHLFWDTQFQDADKAVKCLNKAGKKANSMMDGVDKIEIFVEVLSKYIYLLANKCDQIDIEKVSQLVGVLKTQISEADSGSADESGRLDEVKQFFRLSCQYITSLTQQNDDATVAELFSKIEL